MKTEKNILVAFLLNLGFSLFELIGGIFTGSVAILSDALHDLGDAASIGVSYAFERKSKKKPDPRYTYGYARYSALGGALTTLILLLGSLAVITSAVYRIFHPTEIHYDGMILFAVVGVAVNLSAAIFTRDGNSLNQRAVNLHMLEDALGWIVVLIGAIVMRFTDLWIIDPLISMAVAVFILFHAAKNLKAVVELFLEKTPHGIDIGELSHHLSHIDGVTNVHHLHVWSVDGERHLATLHVVASGDAATVKQAVREELAEHGICHATVEIEATDEHCEEAQCGLGKESTSAHHHHHHHHHHH